MPQIKGRIVAWTKGPPRAFTVRDERNAVDVNINDDVSEDALLQAAEWKGSKATVTANYTATPPSTNALTSITSP